MPAELIVLGLFGGKSIAHYLTENVIVVLVVALAAVVLVFGFGGKIRQAMLALGIVLVAFFLIGASTHATHIGNWLYNLIS